MDRPRAGAGRPPPPHGRPHPRLDVAAGRRRQHLPSATAAATSAPRSSPPWSTRCRRCWPASRRARQLDRAVAEGGIHLLGTSGTVTTLAGVHLGLPRYDRRRSTAPGCAGERRRRPDRDPGRHGLRRARRQSLHRPRTRRPGARRLRHPRGDPPALAVRAPARRRPRPARGHAGRTDGRGRRAGAALAAGAGASQRAWRTEAPAAPGRRALKMRVKTAKRRKTSSTRWLERQLNDPYVARAKAEGYRARSAYKLIEIDDRYHLLKPGKRVVDLGAAPGGWSQVAAASASARPTPTRWSSPSTISTWTRFPASPSSRRISSTTTRPTRLIAALGGAGRRRAVGHGGADHRPPPDRPSAHHALVRGGGRFRRRACWSPAAISSPRSSAAAPRTSCSPRLKRDFASVHHVKPPASRAAVGRALSGRQGLPRRRLSHAAARACACRVRRRRPSRHSAPASGGSRRSEITERSASPRRPSTKAGQNACAA